MTPGNLWLIALTAVANVALGTLILSRNSRSKIHRYFAFFSFVVAAWTVSNGLVSTYADSPVGYVWGRLAFAFAALIPVAFLLFANVFPNLNPAPSASLFRLFVGSGSLFVLASVTPLIVRSTSQVGGSLRVEYGPLHLPFAVYFVSCLGFSLFLLTRKLVLSSGLEKLQVRYVFAGVLAAAVGATIANLIIPLLFRTSQFSRYGPLFGLLMIAVIAHTIIRHRLLDIKVVVRKGVVYVCAIVTAAMVFVLTAELLKRLGAYKRDSISIFEALAVALILAIAFQPLKNMIQRSLNRYLYRETYDYQRTVREASQQLSTILDLDPLLKYLVNVIKDTFKVERIAVFLRDQTAGAFTQKVLTSSDTLSADPIDVSPLGHVLQSRQTAIVREEVMRRLEDDGLTAAVHTLTSIGGDLAFPLLDEHALYGMLVVGPKRSGDPYFGDDINLLETLVNQAAIALKNAQLYRQVVLANEYVDNILSTMDSGLIAVDEGGTISMFNSSAQRITGLQAQHFVKRPYTQLPTPLMVALRDALALHSSPTQFETTMHLAGDASVPLVCSSATLRHRDGSVYGALVVFSDLTQIKDLEREKRRSERLASFGALASGVAHEIKNPLVAIRTFAELLPERFTDVDFREDFSKVVIKEIARIDDLVGRLRGIAATAPQQVGSIDIRMPIQDTLLLLRAQMEQTRTSTHFECHDPSPVVAVQESQLKQLFLNLFLNAVEAMGPGGQLEVRVFRKDHGHESWVSVEVSDTGPGIPDAVRTNIFEPFFTTKPKGSGLGLAICRGIMDAHRGTIKAENRPARQGATILLEFPAAAAAPTTFTEEVMHR